MTGEEFVLRFAQHILPQGCFRVRYAGLFSAGYRKRWLPKCRELLGSSAVGEPDNEASPDRRSDDASDAAPIYGPECRRCGTSTMVSHGQRSAAETPTYLLLLRLLCDRLFTFVTTINIDRTSRTVLAQSIDCLPPLGNETFTTLEPRTSASLLPKPDT